MDVGTLPAQPRPSVNARPVRMTTDSCWTPPTHTRARARARLLAAVVAAGTERSEGSRWASGASAICMYFTLRKRLSRGAASRTGAE